MDSLLRLFGLSATTTLYGNPLADWCYALGLGLVTFLTLLTVRRHLLGRARRYAGVELPAGVQLLLRLVARTRILPLLAVSLLAGSKYLELGSRAERFTSAVLVLAVTLQLGLWLSTAIRYYLEQQSARSGDRNAQTMVTLVQFVANVVIWSLVGLLALDNLGIQVKALLTGLGIGGIAVALAVQNVLGDLLASLSIALDRPFGIGDALVLDSGYAGTVEAIGIKSTRLRSVSGEQIVLANSELVKTRIRNYGRIAERRSVFRIGVAHGTPAALLARVPGLVEAAIVACRAARFERAHLVGFSNTSVDYEAVYVVAGGDYRAYLDAQQAISLALAAAFEEAGVEFASLTPLAHTQAHLLAPPA